MGAGEEASRALELARTSGLIVPGEPLLVMLSGGGDSVCLLDVAVRLGAEISALHVNYGLRPGADQDEAHCRELCRALGVVLRVERVELRTASGGPGNLQAEARDARYALAERHAVRDYASAHTAGDQAETVLYRLAASPGRTALLGMAPRRGRLVRPLLEVTRDEARAHCRAHGLEWREDPSNEDRGFARARVRHELLPVLRGLAPDAERTIAQTARLLRDEAEVLEAAVDHALTRLGGGRAVPLDELRSEPPALARLVLRRLAQEAAGGPRALSRRDADRVLELGGSGGSASLDLGGGLRALVEYGLVRFSVAEDEAVPEPITVPVPGSGRFGRWEVEARLDPSGEVLVSRGALGREITVRAWRSGDRMRPAGLAGTKTLQDVFTDAKVPRALRRTLPVVEVDGEIAWVAGVAVGERFLARAGGRDLESEDLASLSARLS